MTTATTTALDAAAALVELLPSPGGLTPRPAKSGERPSSGTQSVRASSVGFRSVDVVLALSAPLLEILESVPGVALGEATRPALEAAVAVVGPGVLGTVESAPTDHVFAGMGEVVVLEDGDGPAAWLLVREHEPVEEKAGTPLEPGSMKLLYDVEMTLTAEIGRTNMQLRDVLSLTPGAVLELDRSAGSPADVMVNGRLIARGEVVVLDEDYAVRITEIIPAEGDAAR